jgi:hypothetical protein
VFNAEVISFLTLTVKKSPKTKGIFNPVCELLVDPLGIGNCVIIDPFLVNLLLHQVVVDCQMAEA